MESGYDWNYNQSNKITNFYKDILMTTTKEVNESKNKDNALVFISHDTRDAEIAEAFSKLLSSVTAGVLKSFRSSDNKGTQGIEYGMEWYPKIIDALQGSSDVVCLLTSNSLNRPWILFEAGMAKGKMNTTILGLAIGIPLTEVSSGPFAQFQNCDDNDDALTKLVKQLVSKIPNAEPDEEVIRDQVKNFKTKIEAINMNGKKNEAPKKEVKLDSDAAAKLFEEVKIMFKELPHRLERAYQRPIYKNRRFHPGMLEELFMYSHKFNPKIALQMVLTPIKNDFPWIYEGALECAEKIKKSKSNEAANEELREFMHMIDISFEHPIMREFYMDDEMSYRFHKEIPMQLHRILSRYIETKNFKE